MIRLTLHTCGVLAEIAALSTSGPSAASLLPVAGLLFTGAVWWKHTRSWVDHLVGLDL